MHLKNLIHPLKECTETLCTTATINHTIIFLHCAHSHSIFAPLWTINQNISYSDALGMWRNPCIVLHGAQSWRSASVRLGCVGLGWVQLGSVQLRFFFFFLPLAGSKRQAQAADSISDRGQPTCAHVAGPEHVACCCYCCCLLWIHNLCR